MFEVVYETESRIVPAGKSSDGRLNAVRITIPIEVIYKLSRFYGYNIRDAIVMLSSMNMHYPCKIKLVVDKERNEPFLIIEIPKIKIEFKT